MFVSSLSWNLGILKCVHLTWVLVDHYNAEMFSFLSLDRKVSFLHASPAQRQTVVSVHGRLAEARASPLDGSDVLCVWDIWQRCGPQKVLVCESEVQRCGLRETWPWCQGWERAPFLLQGRFSAFPAAFSSACAGVRSL